MAANPPQLFQAPGRAQVPTPPESPRKRRRELRESEDTDGEIFIETYLANSDPYRSTSAALPLPCPRRAVEAPEEVQAAIRPLRPAIFDILYEYGFSGDMVVELVDITKPGYPGGDIATTTLKVNCYSTVPRSLGPAKDRIGDLLALNRLSNIAVEITHPFYCFQPSLFPIKPDHAAVGRYDEVKGQIVECLDEAIPSAWRVLLLVQLGRTERQAIPTVVVYVEPRTAFDWASLVSKIQRVLDVPSTEIGIEVLPGSLSELTPPSVEGTPGGKPGISFERRMDSSGTLQMGDSIGLPEEQGGGTLGGFMTLTLNDTTHKGFLTNYHVVRPSESTASPDVCLHTDRFGCNVNSDKTRTQIAYFANKDIEATRHSIEMGIQSAEEEARKSRAQQQERAEIGARPHLGLERTIEIYDRLLPELHRKLNVVNSMPTVIGTTLLSSGKSLISGRVSDWAFVELTETMADKFFRFNEMPYVRVNQTPAQYGIDSPVRKEGVPLVSTGSIQKGEYYLKAGRSTEVTGGISNGTLAYCSWSERDRVRYDADGNKVEITAGRTEEYVVFSKRTNAAECVQSEFCEPGDSGSLVLDSKGSVCGLLYGDITGLCGAPGEEHMYSGAGLVTPMPDVMRSISAKSERDTGTPAVLDLA